MEEAGATVEVEGVVEAEVESVESAVTVGVVTMVEEEAWLERMRCVMSGQNALSSKKTFPEADTTLSAMRGRVEFENEVNVLVAAGNEGAGVAADASD